MRVVQAVRREVSTAWASFLSKARLLLSVMDKKKKKEKSRLYYVMYERTRLHYVCLCVKSRWLLAGGML